MSKPKAVGIDLGTTYSAMAWVDESNHSEIVTNAEGDLLTPSVVLFEDDRVLVGREAKKLGIFETERMVECAKREIGSPLFSRAIAGRELPPEVILAFILKKMKNDLDARLSGDLRCVITVPAFFDEPRRKATMDAAQMAGLQVLDIVNEPTAAAIAYGEELGYLREGALNKTKMYVLVFDLGGGTFDCTLIEMQSGNLRTVATDGDFRLGGRDWDTALVDYAAAQFEEKFQCDPRKDHATMVRMLSSAEEVKHTLTARKEALLRVSHSGDVLDVKITRDQFEEETAHLLERTAYVARQLLTAAGLTWPDLGKILLVGGSTRMPMVSAMLRDRTGLEPEHGVNPDEAVARGAALYADFLLAARVDSARKPSFKVTNVNSHSLGIEGVDQSTGRRRNNVVIPRNSPLPAKKTEKFVTRTKAQKSVVVKVLEGESTDPSECTAIGRTVIRNLPRDLAANWPIMVTYEYGANGRLNVTARVHGTDRETKLELEREGALSNSMVVRWARVLESGCGLAQLDAMLEADAPSRAGPGVSDVTEDPLEPSPVPARPQPRPAAPSPVPLRAASSPQPAVPQMAGSSTAAYPQAPSSAPSQGLPSQGMYPSGGFPQQPAAPVAAPPPPRAVRREETAPAGLAGGPLLMVVGAAAVVGMLLAGLLVWAFLG